VKLYNNLAT